MAWAPRYGLKGMIDASMRVIIDSNGHIGKIMPLELKTGKGISGQASFCKDSFCRTVQGPCGGRPNLFLNMLDPSVVTMICLHADSYGA